MKKKILAIVLCVAMLAIAIVGGTMAYFTDTKAQTNTFTTGNVSIKLDEVVVQKVEESTKDTYGDLVAKGDGSRTEDDQDYGKLYPGQKIAKDPTITNTGSEDAYIAAKITVTSEGDIHSYLDNSGEWKYMLGVSQLYDNIDINVLASGGLLKKSKDAEQDTNWNGLSMVYKTDDAVIYQVADRAAKTYTFYIFILEAKATNESVVLFEELEIPAAWDNAEMDGFKGFSINVQAFATQEYGFKDCYTAMTTAFPEAFDFT